MLKRILTGLGFLVLGILTIVLVLGLVPLSNQEMLSNPEPVAEYNEAVAQFDQVKDAELGIVNDASGSLLLVHGQRTPRVYVLVHGITNSPLQWKELGEILHGSGHNVLILRMPYHGLNSHHVRELGALKAEDLRSYADCAVDIASGLGDELVVVGISGGGTVASWMVQNRSEVDQALLLAPFFGVRGVPGFANMLLMNAFSRLPNIVLDNPLEPRRDWVYRGEATRGVAAFLAIGADVIRSARDGNYPTGQVMILTTAIDDTANNRSTEVLIDLWRTSGAEVIDFTFEPSLGIPHNSVDPSADEGKKQVVYQKILELLGENGGS